MSRSVRWRGSSIHTANSLVTKRRRLDRRTVSVEQTLSELRRGATLHLSYSPRRQWRLSTGAFITDEVAHAVVALPSVVGVGRALFEGLHAQVYRFITEKET
jgi:hypothetical protein